MLKYAIIVAAGKGIRMGSPVPKQFLKLNGKPLIFYTINAFIEAYQDIQLVLVLPPNNDAVRKQILDFFPGKKISFTDGGETRFHSVYNGLRHIKEEAIVFVHDGVRCLVKPALIHRCYETAIAHGSAIPAISSRDSVRIVTANGNEVFNREKVKLIQTPQTFRSRILLPAYDMQYQEHFTDEATVVEAAGNKITIVDGDENNIKVTTPLDLKLAEALLS